MNTVWYRPIISTTDTEPFLATNICIQKLKFFLNKGIDSSNSLTWELLISQYSFLWAQDRHVPTILLKENTISVSLPISKHYQCELAYLKTLSVWACISQNTIRVNLLISKHYQCELAYLKTLSVGAWLSRNTISVNLLISKHYQCELAYLKTISV